MNGGWDAHCGVIQTKDNKRTRACTVLFVSAFHADTLTTPITHSHHKAGGKSMSFGQTPLQSSRRLDHNTFLNKPPSNGPRDPKPLPPTSAIYGHTEPVSPRRDLEADAPALDRFRRLKQEQAISRPGATKTITSPLKPGRWDYPDTSVNIAGAFNTAVNTALTSMNTPNQSWSSGVTTSQPHRNPLGRSTSEEFEQAAATAAKRLQVSNNRAGTSRSHAARKPISKSASFRNGVPDSEEEEQTARNERGKSPFDEMVSAAKDVVGAASFYVKQKLQQAGPGEQRNTREESYGYEDEEEEYQNQSTSARRMNGPQTHKRGRMSVDKRAYKPTQSDEESDEDYESDGKTKRRKKKKKEPAGSMNHLPVIAPDKRKKKKRGKKGTAGEAEGDEATESDEASEQVSLNQRTSLRPETTRHPSLPRELSYQDDYGPDTSMDIEQGLNSIPEGDEDFLPDIEDEPQHPPPQPQRRSVSRPPSSRIGGPLGQFVHYIMAKILSLIILGWSLFSSFFYFSGGFMGHVCDILVLRPFRLAARASSGPLLKAIILGLAISGLYTLREPLLQYVVPRLGSRPPVYQAPEAPAANVAEFAARLQVLEAALAELSLENEKLQMRADTEEKVRSETAGKLGLLEMKVGSESRKVAEVEARVRDAANEGLGVVQRDIEVLQAQVQASQQQRLPPRSDEPANDEEARARVRALEERVGGVEGGVKEALEIGKKAASSSSNASPGAAWWNKLASGSAAKSGLTIKSSDGQDVTSLIGHLVDTAVSTYSKDTIARPDYALHSGGARVIPSLTSPTYEITPSTLRGSIFGYITGNGYAIGRPPVSALHHELHNGHCWPVQGHSGQLGVALAAPIYIDEVTIDHVASEVAFDMRSAPREMELWGLVEGMDNSEKIREWLAERSRLREAAKENGEEVDEEPEPPRTLPRDLLYVRVANFAYDVHAPRNVQTFPVDPELRALGVDFGVVVLIMKSNWGREFTCLYRLRVHGQRIEGQVQPLVSSEEEV
ncbi:hypothetical protein DXG01_002206 [Tephrocybe rancida]|nr:hypothetical protein DXG01_002206 [Tephrocybe rancida]